MSLTINLSEPFERELTREAKRDGIAPVLRAELLLRLALALRVDAPETPFVSAVRAFFQDHEIDPDRLVSALDRLNEVCIPNARHPIPTFSADGDSLRASEPVREESSLRRWRDEAVHRLLAEGATSQANVTTTRPSIRGKYAYLGLSLEDFMREKREEIDREDRKLWP